MNQLHFMRRRIERVDRGHELHAEVKKRFLVQLLGIACHLDFHLLLMKFLLGIEDAVQLRALMAGTLLVDERAALVENVDHLAAACVQVIFDHRLGLPHDFGDFGDLEFIDFLQENADLLLQQGATWKCRQNKT
jgi:hypothetical protein